MTASPLRWVGGKAKWKGQLGQLFRLSDKSVLCEPFLGGGSVALALQPHRLVAGDTNRELINFYDTIASDLTPVLEAMKDWADDAETFQMVRSLKLEETSVAEAARFLYLNRTAFLGMYRLNRSGNFNVPYGGGGRLHVRDLDKRLNDLVDLILRSEVFCDDFEAVLGKCTGEEFVFCDPPYGTGDDKPFDRYSRNPFSLHDHRRLASALHELTTAGCAIGISLPAEGPILGLYHDYHVVHARRSTSTFGSGELICIDPVFFDRAIKTRRRTLDSWQKNRRWHDGLL